MMIKKILCVLAAVISLALFVTAEDVPKESTEAVQEDIVTENTAPQFNNGKRPSRENMERPENVPEMPPQGFDTEAQSDEMQIPDITAPTDGTRPDLELQGGRGNRGQGGMPQNFMGEGMNGIPLGQQQTPDTDAQSVNSTAVISAKSVSEIIKENFTPIFSMVLLVAAFVFVIFYKRKNF